MDHRSAAHECDRRPAARYAKLVETRSECYTDRPDHGYENTFIDAPETPAHQFAVKALKRAVFGTPAPDDTNNASKKLQKKPSPDLALPKVPTFALPKEDAAPVSPSKLPGGILMTPGTASRGRKSVKFGAHVVDNEGKRGNAGRSGVPSDCPGKFPSPWTPGTELKAEPGSEQKPRTKLTAALMDARTTTQPRSGQKTKARDDSDITMDLGAPRSDSGKYWKEQYDLYAARSEREVKKLISKQQLAKNYAMKKDGEVTELITKLGEERKRHRRREQELEEQNKDFQERLRKALGEQTASGIEITALKNRIATLEKSLASNSSDLPEPKSSSPFEIFEDSSKRAKALQTEQDKVSDASYLSQKIRPVSIGKENSPPKPRTLRRQTMPEPSSLPQLSLSTTPRMGADAGEVSTILGRSSRAARRENEPITQRPSLQSPERASISTLSIRKRERSRDNIPRSPVQIAPSSPPLPQPSPDPWMDPDQSSIAVLDKMALPIGGGGGSGSYSRPSRPARNRRQGASKPTFNLSKATTQPGQVRETADRAAPVSAKHSIEKPERTLMTSETVEKHPTKPARSQDVAKPPETEKAKTASIPADRARLDASKTVTGGAEEVPQAKRSKVPDERKSKAAQRIAERKKRKAEEGQRE